MAKTWTVTNLGLSVLSEAQGTVIARWKFDTGSTTDHFQIWWYWYSSTQKKWIIANDGGTSVSTGTYEGGYFQAIYTTPNDTTATSIKCWVRPFATKNSKGAYKWASAGVYSPSITSPRVTAAEREKLAKPEPPSVSGEVSGGWPTLSLECTAQWATTMRIQRSVNGGTWTNVADVAKSTSTWKDKAAAAGSSYRYRVRSVLANGTQGNASDVVGPLDMRPSAPSSFSVAAVSTTAARINWTRTGRTGTWYEVQWSEDGSAWDNNDTQAIRSERVESASISVHTVSGLATGQAWFFRVKVGNDSGESWAKGGVRSVTLGTTPSAPTAYSSQASASTSDTLTCAWTHNCEDGSAQTAWELRVGADGAAITLSGTDESQSCDVELYGIGAISNGSALTWKVRTKGALDEWSPWSIEQAVRIWDPPTLGIMLAGPDGGQLDPSDIGYVMEAFPLTVAVVASEQVDGNAVLRWWASIAPADDCLVTGRDGEDRWVRADEEVWSVELPASDESATVLATDVTLVAGMDYRVRGGCVTEAGIVAEASPVILTASMDGDLQQPYATFDFDVASLTCTIWPWCYAAPEGDSPDIEDVLDGELAEGVELSVWRVDAGGAVTLIGDGIANDGTQWVRDPHPTFGTCTYRIVATDLATGAQAATDGTVETPWARVCIQWDEDWLLVVTDGVDGERPEGHRLDLPYNLRIKETSDPDVVLREYDGRDAPVAYYGTQLGIGGDWTADLRKGIDEAERAALRELMRWRDDCYVRDPYGNGYWASVQVRSLDHDYDSEAEAVSITVTRVAHEGA